MRVTAEAPRPLPPLASLLLFRDGVAPARGESVIKYKSSLNVLKDTYDYSCY
jgi:hypothetical protein